MAIKRLTTQFNLREDIFDSITPYNKVQDEIRAPAGEWKPAAWLPVQYTSTNVGAGTDAYVISSGKAVAFDSEGRVVPAGLRSALGGNGATLAASTVLTYTQTDVDWGVIDLTTGEAVTAATSYLGTDVAEALIERGLVRSEDVIAGGGAAPPTTDAHVNVVIDLFISRPVGIAAYDVHVWSGRPEDGDQVFTNYSKQHLIQFLTEIQMRLPHHVPSNTTSDAFVTATLDGGGSHVYVAGDLIRAGEYWDATNFSQLTRYGGTTASTAAVALGLNEGWVARHTDRTPFTCDNATVLIRQRNAPEDVVKAGDWYLDAEVGVLFISSATWATLVAGTATITMTYDFYDTALAAAHKHVHFSGACRPGDFVAVDDQSNFVVATTAQTAAGEEIIGRVLQIQRQPIPLLNEVKTAWDLTGMSAASQMPGSATKGFTDLITLSGETVADQVVIVNVRV